MHPQVTRGASVGVWSMAVLGAQVGDSQERFALKGAFPTCCQLLWVRQCLPQKYVPTLPRPEPDWNACL